MNAKRFGLYTLLVGLTGGCSSVGYGPNSPDYYPELPLSFTPVPDSMVLASETDMQSEPDSFAMASASADFSAQLASHERLP